VLDHFFFYKGRAFEDLLLFDPPRHELFVRSGIIVVFLLFGLVVSRIIANLKEAEEELKMHRENLAGMVDKRTAELAETISRLHQEIAGHRRTEIALRKSESQLRDLSAQIIAAEEKERTRISRELHDGLGEDLTLMKLQLRSLEGSLGSDQMPVREGCEALRRSINQIIEKVGRISRDLSPHLLEDLGLSAAIRSLADNFAKSHDIQVTLEIADVDNLFSQDAQIMLYRIVQEALTNVGKHAAAKNVTLTIRRAGDTVSLLLADDGKGFDMEKVSAGHPSEKGLGFTFMRERAQMLRGTFALRTEEGKGTQITLTLPIKQEGLS
jgi:signal transduction histidine kinase